MAWHHCPRTPPQTAMICEDAVNSQDRRHFLEIKAKRTMGRQTEALMARQTLTWKRCRQSDFRLHCAAKLTNDLENKLESGGTL